jgi:hypothetical protein
MTRYSLALKKKIPQKKKPEKTPKTRQALTLGTLEKDIENIVANHSGGLKLTELIPELLTKRKGLKVRMETIMSIIDLNQNLMMLEYTWRANNRTKYFIYTP